MTIMLLGLCIEWITLMFTHIKVVWSSHVTPFLLWDGHLHWSSPSLDISEMMHLAFLIGLLWGHLVWTLLPMVIAKVIHPAPSCRFFSPITWGLCRLVMIQLLNPSLHTLPLLSSLWSILPVAVCRVTATMSLCYGLCDLMIHSFSEPQHSFLSKSVDEYDGSMGSFFSSSSFIPSNHPYVYGKRRIE